MQTEPKEIVTKEETTPEVTEAVRHPLSLPGKPLSFEEAKELTFQKYDNALSELAK